MVPSQTPLSSPTSKKNEGKNLNPVIEKQHSFQRELVAKPIEEAQLNFAGTYTDQTNISLPCQSGLGGGHQTGKEYNKVELTKMSNMRSV